ncbi:15531_t:CDS:2 [Funneliformis mosseae]|uniref:15531_t:CDS:1 n=1 Tax=Funneliformis mosseae TaxID=27381 RepID=A0A9N8UYH0_FUNMO|nr:15531_t:CDS:2 [Funneliformis mosseae]
MDKRSEGSSKKPDPNVQNDELYEDSLLIIKWNLAGLVYRNNQHGINAINILSALIRDQPGCIPFPNGTSSDSAFSFVRTPNGEAHQNLYSCISQLTTSTAQWWRHTQGNPDVDHVYMVGCHKKGEFVISEFNNVFNV